MWRTSSVESKSTHGSGTRRRTHREHGRSFEHLAFLRRHIAQAFAICWRFGLAIPPSRTAAAPKTCQSLLQLQRGATGRAARFSIHSKPLLNVTGTKAAPHEGRTHVQGRGNLACRLLRHPCPAVQTFSCGSPACARVCLSIMHSSPLHLGLTLTGYFVGVRKPRVQETR